MYPTPLSLDVAQALDQDHVVKQELIETVTHKTIGDMRLVRSPIRFDGTGPAAASAPSSLGEDTVQILQQELGMDEAGIAELISKKIISIS